jgi:allantoicase
MKRPGAVGADHSTPSFTALADLASGRVGGRAIATNDDFFAPMANLVKAQAPVFVPGKYTSRGKWMDGWESRRRRTPGHDWCTVKLGLRGVVHGVNIGTQFFTGNFPSHASLDALDEVTGTVPVKNVKGDSPRWTTLLPKAPLKGNGDNLFTIADRRPWTHLRLNIYPDGGVARLRVYGEAAIDWARIAKAGRPLDLASILNGGLVLGASDMHFGARDNMIMPGRAPNMGDGWETRRRRGPGAPNEEDFVGTPTASDWAIIRLGAPGSVTRVEIDTNHYKGNFPESASLWGTLAPGAPLETLEGITWIELLPRTPLRAHHRHFFATQLRRPGPVSHVRLHIYPDGGISRLRVHGLVAPA